MPELDELNKIKKVYGENFMKLCRELFPTILETEGKLYEILSVSFSENCKTLYEDITSTYGEEEFKSYIYSTVDVETPQMQIIEKKTPYELLEKAGYDLIECTTEEEIQEFKKYYAENEQLCTFRRGGRLNRCVVFFAVKKDANKIKREEFKEPKREDEYGTSVMSIQFNKKRLCTVSIKNRYNHTVNNPDATYGNDLDRIIPGLTSSFAKLLQKRGLKLKSNIEELDLPNYTLAEDDGKYYKFNIEIDNTYYCPGNIIIKDGQVHKLENPEKQILIDYFVLNIDKDKSTIQLYDSKIEDSFIDEFNDIEKVEITKNKEKGNSTRTITLYKKGQEHPIIIGINKNNQITEYKNENLTEVGNNFLYHNNSVTEFLTPNLTEAGNCFLPNNNRIREFSAPKLTEVGNAFFCMNNSITEFLAPNLRRVGNRFFYHNNSITEFSAPKLTEVGNGFFYHNNSITEFSAPNLTEVGNGFFCMNNRIREFSAPNLTEVGNDFFFKNHELSKKLLQM